MSDDPRTTRIADFCKRLGALGPGDRARLKRAAGRPLGQDSDVLGLFYRLLPAGVGPWEEETYYLVATLYPLVDPAETGCLGKALALARSDQNGRGLDRRVETLLDSDESQLPVRLRHTLHFLQSSRVGVEWPRLLKDLLQWNHPERHVQKEWARRYYAPRDNEGSEE